MPTIRKLAQDEIESQKGKKLSQRQRTAREYDAMVGDFELGNWGEVTLAEDDNRLTVRNRLQSAAERRGVALSFLRTQGSLLRFEVVPAEPKQEATTESKAAASATAAKNTSDAATEAPAKRKPGRKPKQPA